MVSTNRLERMKVETGEGVLYKGFGVQILNGTIRHNSTKNMPTRELGIVCV